MKILMMTIGGVITTASTGCPKFATMTLYQLAFHEMTAMFIPIPML